MFTYNLSQFFQHPVIPGTLFKQLNFRGGVGFFHVSVLPDAV